MAKRIPVWIRLLSACVIGAGLPHPAAAETIVVAAEGNLQAALNSAMPGDVIALEPGAVYLGNFVLPNKGASTDYITIRSAAPDELLPPAGVRMTPAYAALLPKIRSSNNMSALRTATASHHWKLMFLEFQSNVGGYGDIIALGAGDSTQTQLSQVPYAFVLDRLYVHGDPVQGQKRGIALHSSDTTVINSHVSDCKAIGQDSQAISGFNGPGNYLIENNYLEAATENFLLGGADPTIPNLVTTNVTFRRNYLRKPVEWRDPIMATPQAVTAAAAPGAGSLAAGTYYYKVAARATAGQTNKANSKPSVEVSATVAPGTTGGVTLAWTPVVGATEYIVYGRKAGGENMYWKTTAPVFTDTGAAGSSGTPAAATKWAVKNIFELKNAQDVLVEGNVFENLWVADQPGYPIVFTPRNQNGTAPWVVVQRVTFRHNIVRHTAGGVNILGVDNLEASQRTNHITVADNIFDDMIASTWGSGSKPFQIGDGPDTVTIDHNTVMTSDSSVLWLYGGSSSSPTVASGAAFTNNMAVHSSYGIMGSNFAIGTSSINAYMPDGVVRGNVLAGGSASRYPTGNFFPSMTAWKDGFIDHAAGDYHLAPSSPYKNAATDGTDLGADVDRITAETASALTGDNRGPVAASEVHITTTELPNGTVNQTYAQMLACTTTSGACAWQVRESTLPDGVTFDATAAVISGRPTAVQTGSITVDAYDPKAPATKASATLALTIDAPRVVVVMPNAPGGRVGVAYQLAPTVSGILGAASWSVASGALPEGVFVDSASGAVSGTPSAWGSFAAVIQAQDSWAAGRSDSKPVAMTVEPSALAVATTALERGVLGAIYGATLTTSGGTGAANWSITGGALPDGMTFDSRGGVSGTPSTLGTFSISVLATDANWPSNTASATFTLTVDPPPFTMTMAASLTGRVGEPMAVGGSTAGQVGAVTWSLQSGALPPGVALNASTGEVSGTPALWGTFSAVVQAADALDPAHRIASAPVSFAIAPSREIVLYASDASKLAGTWAAVADASAAGGSRLSSPDKAVAKLSNAQANPTNYFEMTFQAEAGVAYHFWMRGKADKNNPYNDSVFVQFSGSVDANGQQAYRIGTTSASDWNLEDCSGCGLSSWGWQDNGWGVNVAGPDIFFATTGTQTIRVQTREDGLSIDQIVLSASRNKTAAPGALKNDSTIVSR